MRCIFLLFMALLHIMPGHCQTRKNKFNAGAGILLAIPVYNLNYSTTGGGIDAIALYGITDKISITADIGFVGLPGKSVYPSTAILPVRAGARYFVTPKIYMGAKAGLGVYTILKASANHFAYSAGAGYLLAKKIDAALYYDGYTNNNTSFGYAGMRFSYYFLKN